ncbi:hydantoinase/oxoprolinase family protein [Paraburkholderia pallida]|uniref:Hydantoinase/oxoprolinase family protein n=1 Tax=Paraburkholderia pallida TaxID=2547399 RepID=A0A4P7D6F6_9BURK|nr:hydantoinase/oxoprolinase family protein [Paraburkholderia pallida]QBR04391.1 hydantoinase/oxoprolinase family protein [Paraburkholderia pallida]
MQGIDIIGIDIGGTFTDFVAYDCASGTIKNWKNLTTPKDPIQGVLEGLTQHPDPAGVAKIRLGTTIATNALLERRGAKIAYVTTEGFRDVPFIQRGDRRSHYDISWIKTKPLVRRRECFEIPERLSAKGEVVTELDEAAVLEVALKIKADPSIEAVAICTLFSYVDPTHERRIAEIFAQVLPDLPVSISYDVLPKWKEYERASTTIADAYLKPIVSRSFNRMQKHLDELGVGEKVGVIKSNGGESTLRRAAEAPVQMALSGPTGAAVATRVIAQLCQLEHLVTFDMGGTSTDCTTVVDGKEHLTTDFEIEWGLPIQVPMIDIHTIGAGGGSIAWIDKGGMLRMGPQSAGADPGPAAYGRGGEHATVTDANVVLGRINPDYFLGGKMKLDAAAARRAVKTIADQLGMEVDDAAYAMIQIANNNMLGALRTVLLQRGLDPRDFTLVSSGGAGPVHICDMMEISGIPRGLVPNYPGQFSAFGFIMTDARVDQHRTVQQVSTRFEAERVARVAKELVERAYGELHEQGYRENIEVYRSVEARYLGQNHELEIVLNGDDFDEVSVADLWARFHAQHEARFGFAIPGETIELVNLKVTAVALGEKPKLRVLPEGSGTPASTGSRRVRFESGWIDTPTYDRDTFLQGQTIAGPAVIEESASVTILRPNQSMRVDPYGNLIISV